MSWSKGGPRLRIWLKVSATFYFLHSWGKLWGNSCFLLRPRSSERDFYVSFQKKKATSTYLIPKYKVRRVSFSCPDKLSGRDSPLVWWKGHASCFLLRTDVSERDFAYPTRVGRPRFTSCSALRKAERETWDFCVSFAKRGHAYVSDKQESATFCFLLSHKDGWEGNLHVCIRIWLKGQSATF